MRLLRKRGQISLEFLLVFGILLIMLLYSARSMTFNNTSSREALLMQVAVEEKSTANIIASAIDQVYAQGPGSKVTVYAHFTLLRNGDYLKKAFNLTSPVINIILAGENDPLFPAGASNSIVAVAVSNQGNEPIISGSNRTGVWVQTFLKYNATSHTRFEVNFTPSTLPPVMKVVVEWNPAQPISLVYNSTSSTLHINIRVKGS
ncbi:class III signal peptide-containing protein [Thermococcus sp.]|uniref:class III signal peptide-containing protein n=1 Tax=Thermococcus sp. TaxID=35749 RepID=UPI00262F36DD|nr:class III signal peptide-containing protein [Thermococcus sp.]